MSGPKSFVEACRAGEALLADIDDWVEVWHEEDGVPDGRRQSLAQFLGLTNEEYALWVERPESLRFTEVTGRDRRLRVSAVD